jgi:Na+:H+ antiporter, NhaA family
LAADEQRKGDPYEGAGVTAPEGFERPWLRSDKAVVSQVIAPLERFLRLEAGSGFLLLAAAAAALIWANVSEGGYEAAWSTEITLTVGDLELSEDLRHWINDLLMALFFCLIALEVKREILFGELKDRRLAAVPIAAAVGGMVVPALIYVAVNANGGSLDGWAVPLATDVAFALAVLAMIGRMAPGPLRALLLTVAIVDDIGTIVVIALFFSGGLELAWLVGAVGVVGAILLMQRLAIRHLAAYVAAAGLLWLAIFESGVHGTIAGVIVGLLTPSRPFHDPGETGRTIVKQVGDIADGTEEPLEEAMHQTSRLSREAISPLSRVEEALHPWTAFAVLPLFALANAGVVLSLSSVADAFTEPIGLGIVLGLVIGKPLGLLLGSALAVKLGGARLPQGVDWPALGALGLLAGIGFTVALFISGLAFDAGDELDQAKTAILVASLMAAGTSAATFGARRFLGSR